MKKVNKSHRFGKKQFASFLNQNHSVRAPLFTLFYANNSPFQVGVVAPKKLGSAPVRNRVKRQLKAALQVNRHKLKPTSQFIIIANKNILKSTFKNIHDMVLLTLKTKHLIYDQNKPICH